MAVVTAYSYNTRRMLGGTGESSSQPGYTWGYGYGYDANGNLASNTYPAAGPAVTYLPNALGQPTQVGSFATAVSYFPNGAIAQFTYGNGIVHTLTQNARQLPDTSRDAYGTTEVLDDGYDYDGNANVAAISDGVSTAGGRGNRTMTYDGLDRLQATTSKWFSTTATAGTASYGYDVLDNLTRVTLPATALAPARDHYYCYDASGRLTNVKTGSCGGTSVIGLGYDVQGNLANKNGVLYDFDFGNRLRSASNQETYRYDGLGRRVLGWSPTLGNLISQYNRAGQLVHQFDDRRDLHLDYIYLGGSLVAVQERPFAGGLAVKYQHTDALGTPVAVTDASRTVVERSEYEPYGKLLNRPLTDGPGFTGHVQDAATGLTYMQQRYYDPGIGRFLSVDPVTADGNTGGNFNRYWYANNNPYRFTDPDGRYTCSGGKEACNEVNKSLRSVRTAMNSMLRGGEGRAALKSVLSFYGTAGKDNGVHVDAGFASATRYGQTQTFASGTTKVQINQGAISRDYASNATAATASVLVHEATHGMQQRASIAATGGLPNMRKHLRANEVLASVNEAYYALGAKNDVFNLWNNSNPQRLNREAIGDSADKAVEDMCSVMGACYD